MTDLITHECINSNNGPCLLHNVLTDHVHETDLKGLETCVSTSHGGYANIGDHSHD